MTGHAYADDVARNLENLRTDIRAELSLARRDLVAAISQAQNEERAARQRHIEDVARDLRAEFRRETMELREEVGELVAEVHTLIQREKELRDEGDAAVLRMARSVAEAGV